MTKAYLIYKAVSPTGKVYVGMTSQTLKCRIQRHFRHARTTLHPSHFQNALNKHGRDFSWEILESSLPDLRTAQERERFFIQLLGTTDHSRGYNCTIGGETGRPSAHPQEWRPVLRSDGCVFPSAAQASRVMRASKEDAVARSIRRGGACAGFVFRRISVEEYLNRLPTSPDPRDMSPPIWGMSRVHTLDTRLKISRAKRGRRLVLTEAGRSGRLRSLQKPVFRSDGLRFESMQDAASSMGVNRDQLYYAIRNQRFLNGFLLGFQPISPQAEEKARSWTPRRRRGRAKPLYCSNGQVYESLSQAASVLGVDRASLTYRVKIGLDVQGLKFSRAPFRGAEVQS